MIKSGVVTVADAETEAKALDDEALCVRTLEVIADLGDGLVTFEFSEVYMGEMRRRHLTN